MKVGSIDLKAMLEFRPQEGKLTLGSDRMMLFRQTAFGILRSLLFERLGVDLSRSLLAQFGYRCGDGDYRAISTMFDWDTADDRLAAGPVLHSWEGLVLAKPEHMQYDLEDGNFHMFGTWENSYEAEVHREFIGESVDPVCYSLAGYASGYASAFMGKPMLCVEVACAAASTNGCRWEIRPADTWDSRADGYRKALGSTSGTIQKELEDSLERLSAPLLRVWEGVLAMPIIGRLDARRTASITATLLEEIARSQVQSVILDVTGVDKVDEATADSLLRVVAGAELLGARCHLSGVRGDVARALSASSLDLGKLRTFATVRQALRHCIPTRS